jgi:hypothetical protein
LKLAYLILLLFLGSSISQAADGLVIGDFSLGVDPKGVPLGWQLKEKSGKADFAIAAQDGVHALQLRSSSTSYSFQKEIKVDLNQYPVLSWKWKVTKLPEGGDFRRSKTDDQAAQLFVAFSRSQTIVYMWDTSSPQGTTGDASAPPFMSIKVVVMRSGPAETGKWITETRDIYEDYKKLFRKTEVPPVSGMRIQINTQHTKSSGESYLADIAFKKR